VRGGRELIRLEMGEGPSFQYLVSGTFGRGGSRRGVYSLIVGANICIIRGRTSEKNGGRLPYIPKKGKGVINR